jgi:multiple sugar transport system substrate-binding protein
VAYPAEGWTQEDFVAAATAISAKLGAEGVFGAAGAPWTGQETYYNTIYQSGGEVISADGTTSGYDQPGTIAGVKLWVDLAQAGVSPSVAQITDTPVAQYFTSGKLAMMWSGPWNANSLKDSEIADTVAVAPMPSGSSDLVTTIQGGADAVSAFSENKEAAQTFQAFLGSKTAQELYGAAGLGIPAFNGAAGSFTDAFPQWDLSLFSEQAAHAAPYPVSLNTAPWNKLENDFLTKAWTGELTVEEACAQLAEAMNEALAQERK